MLSPAALELLRRLADGGTHSSRALAAASDSTPRHVTRVAAEARHAGFAIDWVRGRGYRLAQPVDFLEVARARAALGAAGGRFDIRVVDSTGSTNADLLAEAETRSIAGRVLVAELQTAGRGRRGQRWHAALGGSLTFSVGWRFALPPSELAGLTLAAGVAVVRGLERGGIAGVGLKWPNDLVWNLHKLGGILVECVNRPEASATSLVVGIGLNVRLPDALRAAIPQPVTDLARIAGRDVDRSALLGLLLAELARVFDEYAAEGFAAIREEWTRLHVYHDRPVQLVPPGGPVIEGTVVGVADDGALLLRRRGGTERWLAGELALRG